MHVLISKVNQSSCNFDIHEPIEAGTTTYLHQNIGSEKDFNELLTNTLPLSTPPCSPAYASGFASPMHDVYMHMPTGMQPAAQLASPL